MTRRATLTDINRPGLGVAEAVARLLLTMDHPPPTLALVPGTGGILPPDEPGRPLPAVVQRPL